MSQPQQYNTVETCLDISLHHEIYMEGARLFRGIAPTRDTCLFFRHNGLRTVRTENRLRLVLESPRHTSNWTECPATLDFYCFTADMNMRNYTELPLPGPGASLTTCPLSTGTAEFSLAPAESGWQQEARASSGSSGVPFALLRIAADRLPMNDPLKLTLRARKVYWRYHVWTARPSAYGELSIQAGIDVFSPVEPDDPDVRPGKILFTSAAPMPLPASPRRNVALCGNRGGMREILISDLPTPRPRDVVCAGDGRCVADVHVGI